jgi:putative spermidine/putrescine transport system substrate-binding protein
MEREMMRRILVGLFGAVGITLAAFGPAQAQQANVTIRVATFGGLFADLEKAYVGDRLTRKTGVAVEFVRGNPNDFLAQIQANRGRRAPFDVVILDDTAQTAAIKAGLLTKLDPALVPNLKNLYPQALNEQGYGPDILYFSVGILYNKQKLQSASIPEPKSWEDLWDARLAGRVSVPDISLGQGSSFAIKMARMAGGGEANMQPGLDKIAKIKAHSYYTSSAAVTELLAAGDVWATVITSGRAWSSIDRGQPVGYAIPKEGGIAGRDTIDMVAGTQYPKEAQMFIDMALDPITQYGFATELFYGPTNTSLQGVLAAYPDLAKKFPASPEDLAQLYIPDAAAYTQDVKKTTDYWNRSVKN